MLRHFVPGDVRGAWQSLAVHACVAVRRTIMGCSDCFAPSRPKYKEAHLTCSELIQRIYKCIYQPTLIYGLECMSSTAIQMRRLEYVQGRLIKQGLGPTKLSHNTALLKH